MALVTKEETLGRATAQEAAPQSANATAKPAAPGVHANAVSLDVPVKVHGSRPASDNSQSERFEEQTSTMIVFPVGGVLRMATVVAPGQMLVLTNLKSRQDAICRVVKVRAISNDQNYVEVEFTRAQASYWGVYFQTPAQRHDSTSTPDAAATQAIEESSEPAAGVHLPPPPAEPAAPRLIEQIADSHEVTPARLPAPPAPAPKLTSLFTSLGTRENVQPAAAATTPVKPPEEEAELIRPRPPQPVVEQSPLLVPPPREVTPRNSASPYSRMNPLPPSAPPVSKKTLSERMSAGSVADADLALELDEIPAPAKPVTAASTFGTRLDSKLGYAQAASPEPRQNWLLVAAAIVVLLGTAAGGAWYFHSNFAKHAGSASAGFSGQPKQPAPQPATVQPLASTQAASTAATDSIPASGAADPSAAPKTQAFASEAPSTASPAAAAAKQPEQSQFTVESAPAAASAPSQPPTASRAASSMMSPSAMKAHPLTSQRDISSPDAPVLNVASGLPHDSGGLPSLDSSGGPAIPPPPDAAQQPMRVGGTVKQPKLVSSVMPVYPFSAREANVQGDVVIDTQISPKGSVVRMNVISGPTMLRQAALDALRRWKYQPSQLDGKPVTVQMLVTIRFRL